VAIAAGLTLGSRFQELSAKDQLSSKSMTRGTRYQADGFGQFSTGRLSCRARHRAEGGVVVIQEIFGVNHHIRAVCDRLAGGGYSEKRMRAFRSLMSTPSAQSGPRSRFTSIYDKPSADIARPRSLGFFAQHLK
jgi:Dienelactone hydrolase family